MNKNVTSEQYRRTITGHKGGFQTLNPNKETICIFIIPSYSFISNKNPPLIQEVGTGETFTLGRWGYQGLKNCTKKSW